MNAVWSDAAKKQFWKVVDYLYENWTEREVLDFTQKTYSLIDRVLENNELCPKSKIIDLRKCLIDKNNSLVYSFQNEIIYIIAIIDNRSAHGY